MKLSPVSLVAALVAVSALPLLAGGDPDFERDAKPILEAQPGLVNYIHSHFVVRETGVARVPGTADQPPQPPFIFSARPRGASGAFTVRLLIQPGPSGHILKVADVRSLPPGRPEPSPAAAAEETVRAPVLSSHPIGSAVPSASSASSSQPSSDTPSGPIRD